MALDGGSALLVGFKSKIEEAVSFVPKMIAEEKLKAVQFWNLVSEKLQEIVNSSAADINALALKMEKENADKQMSLLLPPPEQQQKDFIINDAFDTNTAVPMETTESFLAPSGIESITQTSDLILTNNEPNCGFTDPMDACTLSMNATLAINPTVPLNNFTHPMIPNPQMMVPELELNENKLVEAKESSIKTLPRKIPKKKLARTKITPKNEKDCEIMKSECDEAMLNKMENGLSDEENKIPKPEDIEKDILALNDRDLPFKCDSCQRSFETDWELNEHSSETHTRSFTCKECGRRFAVKANLEVHMRRHTGEKPFQCNICGLSFTTNGNRKRHIRSHTGAKPWKCEQCGQCFTEKKSLTVHSRKHTGERPYECKVCGKRFSQSGILQTHMAVHLNLKVHLCETCGKSFRQRSQLTLHTQRHRGIKKYICDNCPAKFLTKGDLERHSRIHTGERPFTCTLCLKSFTRQQCMNEHMNRHYGTKPYKCKFCPKKFSEMSACYKHTKTHQKENKNNSKGTKTKDLTTEDEQSTLIGFLVGSENEILEKEAVAGCEMDSNPSSASVLINAAVCCHPNNHEFQRCIHVYLERDFVTVESYLEQYNSVRARRVLMEGPTLDEICDKLVELDVCFEYESRHGCFGLVDLEPMSRLLHALKATTDYLCSGEKENLIAFLKNAGCVLSFQKELVECRDERIDWPIIWARIFRLQQDHMICDQMNVQSSCVVERMSRSTCDKAATAVYNKTMRMWLDNWCNDALRLKPNVASLFTLLLFFVFKTYCIKG